MRGKYRAPKAVRDYWAKEKREYRLKQKAVSPNENEALPVLESLPGCIGSYGDPMKPNGPCHTCEAEKNCKATR